MKNKQLRVIIVVVFALILAVTGLTTKTMLDKNHQFAADGYVLIPSRDMEVTTNVNEQHYFAAGTNYRKKFGEVIEFKDTSDKEVTMGVEEFVHYNDGSLGAFTKGVVMDLAEIGDNQVTYYGVSDKTTILKQGQEYSMSYLGNSLALKEFVWKIADDTYMLVAPQITIHLTEDIEVVLEDYVQVQYVAGGIARLVHQHGTYQTVSDDAYISTDSGFELKLTERAFYNGLEKTVSLDEMVIDSSSNLMVDENEESVKIPTFRVVNGKDGADGSDGLTGEDGESGEDGSSGENGEKGQNGFDGLEGNSGEWGYDGQVGEDGTDAEHSKEQDGIVGIVQEGAPMVGIEPDTYKVGANSLDLKLKISDAGKLLVGDMEWSIYKRDTMELIDTAKFNSGLTGVIVSTQKLEPGVDYVFVVEGSYESRAHGLFDDVNFMTKIFRTDELGLSIEKVKVTEDSITVKVVKTDDSLVATYGIALYEGDDITNISSLSGNSYTDSTEFIFKKNENVNAGIDITPNTEYKIQLVNIQATNASSVSANVSKDVKTLKIKPYYLRDNGATTEQVSEQETKILTSSRYQTATVSLDTAIVDVHSGIKGYRYELYETLTDTATITAPIQTKEVQTMETVTFNIEANKKYFGRVVVLFDDNEKITELVTNPSQVVSLDHSSYPTVKFITADGSSEGALTHTYDSISGYIMVEDNSVDQDMLLDHVSVDYPLILSVTAQTGTVHTIKLSSGVMPPAGYADTGDAIEYYYFEVDGLARDITHTVSVSGYVNDTNDRTWAALTADEKAEKLQYLSGYNINVGPPTPIVLSMRQVPNIDDNLFTVAVAFTDEDGNDASYEVGNMEKLTFRLVNDSGVTIGTTGYMMDREVPDVNHSSDYSKYYASHKTTPNVEDLPYSAVENGVYSEYVLTDETFGAKGDMRIANGGTFHIQVEHAYDYTQDDTEFPEVTNELDIKGSVSIEVKKSHARVQDPNSAVTVTPIRNDAMDSPRGDLDDDTIVGLTVDTGYSLSDAYKVEYYVYELTSAAGEPFVKDHKENETDVVPEINKTVESGYWAKNDIYKKKTVMVTNAPTAGGSVPLWTVHFDQMDDTKAEANLDDSGNVLFERGKVYFIRYEVVTNKSLEDTVKTEVYPHCAYDDWGADYASIDLMVPFYRSNVFGLERQEPKIHRYLWDTQTLADTTTTQQWKYLLDDPDNAILAYADFDKNAAVGTLLEYADFETAYGGVLDPAAPTLPAVALKPLYNDDAVPKPKNTYEIVDFTGMTDSKWYTLEIPYCLFELNTNVKYEADNKFKLVSVPGEVKAVSDINTDIAGVHNNAADYLVNGVMVKDVSVKEGIDDEYGYRIKLTLQGTEIERVAAVKVTIASQADPSKVVVYDPVPVKVNNFKSGLTTSDPNANYNAYAYLEYAPIVEAGINQTDTTIKVEAYYTTNRAGMKSFTEYADVLHKNEFTAEGNIFAGTSAWALKQYLYKEDEVTGITTYQYNYMRASDEIGNMIPSGEFSKDHMNEGIRTKVLSGSVFIPKMSADGTQNQGFTNDKTLAFRYTLTPLANTELLQDNHSFSDVMYPNEINLEMDAVGAKGVDDNYYAVEELKKKTLMIDFGMAGEDYKLAEFHTGDGMPGIAESVAGSSAGMSSATMQFDIKGSLPGTDKGYYIYLYEVSKTDSTILTPVTLVKYKEPGTDGKIYYLVEGGIPTTDADVKLSTSNTSTDYALEPDADSDGKKVTFAIRGLNKETTYQVQIKARDTLGNIQDLFDYALEKGGAYYDFLTKSDIELVSSNATFVFNSYQDKYASFQYAVKGSEGTGMRIFYKVYNSASQEVKCGKQTYVDNYGYRLEPLGSQVHYYQSDMTRCIPAELNFNPGGLLKAGETYTIVYTAYRTTNAGVIIDNEKISKPCSVEFTMPDTLASPTSNLQVVSGENHITVRLVVYDREKSIHNGKIYVDAYDLNGNKITTDSNQLKINVTTGSPSTTYVGNIVGLASNQAYKIVVTADLDRNNDGVADSKYSTELTGTTTVTANANVSTSYTAEGYLTFKLNDLVNFTEINKIVYSIDSQDGATNYENASKSLNDWVMVGNTYSYTTSFAPDSGSYHYTIQYYKDNDLKGSSSGYFTK